MKTVEKTFEVYEITELDTNAQDKAYESFINNSEYFWHTDNVESMQAFCDMFDITVKDYSYGGCGRFIKFIFNDNYENPLADINYIRLWKYLVKNFDMDILSGKKDLTGYYIDYVLISPIKEFIEKPTNINFEILLGNCLNNWLETCHRDYEYSLSMESFIEDCHANERLFLIDGEEFFDC